MPKKRKQVWAAGDVFLVETKDHMKVVCQVVADERESLGCASCAFFDLRIKEESELKEMSALRKDRAFSVLFVTPELLNYGVWRVVGRLPVSIPKNERPYEYLRNKGWVGAEIIGGGIVEEFLEAYYALGPWDDWYDPAYLDGLLLSPDKKPKRLIFKKDRVEDQAKPASVREESPSVEEVIDEEDEDSVRVYLRLADNSYGTAEERERIRELSHKLDELITSREVGQFDGDEFGGGNCVLFMYGPDADELFSALEPILKSSSLTMGGWAIKRYGKVIERAKKEVRVEL
jgi:hypothetical protein